MKNFELHGPMRPRDPDTGEQLSPRLTPGYYPGYNTLGQKAYWDKTTRDVVVHRVEHPPELKFFDEHQAIFWGTVFDHVIPQTDRLPERRILILPPLDNRLHEGRTEGYRFEDMPHDRDVYNKFGIEAIDAEARTRFGQPFLRITFREQDLVLRAIHDGCPKGGKEIWEQMNVHRFWQLVTKDAIDAYYAHPWAWDEIGFGGPAYPRAYFRLERGEPEPWEVEEQRYEWNAPMDVVSEEVGDASHHHTEAEQQRHKFARES
jgi:hypothetical protein